jgi:hypothetical protein
MVYDCSLHGGSMTSGTGFDFNWPYTLDNSSPGETNAGKHAGLWEIPVQAVVRDKEFANIPTKIYFHI